MPQSLTKFGTAGANISFTSLVGGTSSTTTGGGISHATASGTDTYTTTITGVTGYNDGDAYIIQFTNGNTTSATLNINSLGAIPLYRNNDGALIGGDIVAGGEMLCVYDNTINAFRVIGTSPNTLLAYVTNAESITITKGQPVYVFGGTGDRITVKLAYNTSDATSAQTIGVVQSTSIAANQKGMIIIQGQLDNLSLFPTSTWADGDYIYLGATAGSITNVKPVAPNHLVYLGYVTTASNGSAGRMYVKVQNGYELDEIHNVLISGVTNNDILAYESATSLWKNKSISGVLGYTPLSAITSSDVTTALGYTPFGGTNPLPVANGGTGISSVTNGDVFYATGGTIAKLAIGTSGQTLSSNGTLPVWATPSSGGMTNPMTTLGDIIYEDATPTPARLAGNTTTTQKFLGQVGNGTISAAPTWFDLFGTANTWSARQTFSATNGILFSYASSNVLTHLQSYVRTTANGDHAQWLSTDSSGNYKAAVRLAIQGSGTGNGILNLAVNQQTTGTTLTPYLTCDGLWQTVAIFKNTQIGATAGTTGILSSAAKSTLDVIGSFSTAITTKTATYTATITDSTILCNATSGAITINLPTTSGIAGRFYTIKKTDSSVNAVTIDANGTQTIDGALTYTLSLQYKYVTIQTDGTNWFVTANN